MMKRQHLPGGLAVLLALTVGIPLGVRASLSPTTASALPGVQAQAPTQLLEQGRVAAAAGKWSTAATLWEEALAAYQKSGDWQGGALSAHYLAHAYLQLGQLERAQEAITTGKALVKPGSAATIEARLLNEEGQIQLAKGDATGALTAFVQAATLYEAAGDEMGLLGARVNGAQAMQSLGLYRRARQTLAEVTGRLESQPNSLVKAAGLRSLGMALQVAGALPEARQALEQSLTVAQQLGSAEATGSALFALGNVAKASGDLAGAQGFYEQAAATAPGVVERTEALLGLLALAVQGKNWQGAGALLPSIRQNLGEMPPSRMRAYAAVNLAEHWMQVPDGNSRDIAVLLAQTAGQALQLQDGRGESLALGQLGRLYALGRQYSEAQAVTQQALLVAQKIDAEDMAARWQGQLGGILVERGDTEGAVAAYSSAVDIFNSLRKDLVAVDSNVQFSFRDTVEPTYRQLISLLVKEEKPSPEKLRRAIDTFEALQVAELDNFFQEACLEAKPKQIDQIDPEAAAIYPIILPDGLDVIVSVPGKPLRHHKIARSKAELDKTFQEFLGSLTLAYPTPQRLSVSRTLYEWIIGPLEAEGLLEGVKTLVFVLDGTLRNTPMAALYDGQKYLIEKYGVVLSPGLYLLEGQKLPAVGLKAIAGGLSEAREGFNPLPNVEVELNQITAEVTQSQLLFNQQFTKESLEKVIGSSAFPVVHLATHGQFSSNAQNTFLLTWDGRLDVLELNELLLQRSSLNKTPIELLVLSACETATGDDRAVLGLAGLAVRSGARSTLATLWQVQDQSTADFMVDFYRELSQSGVNKAEAVRQAQITLIKEKQFDHPFFWAPFILVGNWL